MSLPFKCMFGWQIRSLSAYNFAQSVAIHSEHGRLWLSAAHLSVNSSEGDLVSVDLWMVKTGLLMERTTHNRSQKYGCAEAVASLQMNSRCLKIDILDLQTS
jgi:hypothetical protein